MGTFEEFVAAVGAKADVAISHLAAVAADVAVLASGQLTAEQQAAADSAVAKLDAMSASLTDLGTGVGDRNGDGLPVALAATADPAADPVAVDPAAADPAAADPAVADPAADPAV